MKLGGSLGNVSQEMKNLWTVSPFSRVQFILFCGTLPSDPPYFISFEALKE
jgi:hypothetical protein